MTEEPKGVQKNTEVQTAPPNLIPVPEANWYMFCDEATANTVKGWYDAMSGTATEFTELYKDFSGQYGQFVYDDPQNPQYCIWKLKGVSHDVSGAMAIEEFAGYIFDRNTVPIAFIDKYYGGAPAVPADPEKGTPEIPAVPAQPHKLSVSRSTPTLGQLFWEYDQFAAPPPAKEAAKEPAKETSKEPEKPKEPVHETLRAEFSKAHHKKEEAK